MLHSIVQYPSVGVVEFNGRVNSHGEDLRVGRQGDARRIGRLCVATRLKNMRRLAAGIVDWKYK